MVWNASYFLLDAGPSWVVLPIPGVLLCQVLPGFCDSEMHLDIIVFAYKFFKYVRKN